MEPAQRLDHATRYSLYDAYGGRCAYCNDPVRFRDVELDHIIPQAANHEERAQLCKAAGLPNDWDIHDLQNVVPACRTCNRKKRDYLANPLQIIILTTVAKERLPAVRGLIEAFRKSARADKLRALVDQAITAGVVTWEELQEGRPDASAPTGLRLMRPVDPIDIAVSELTEDDIERLLHQPLRYSIDMQFADGMRRPAHTVSEYYEYRKAGAFAPTATDLRLEGFFKNASAVLRAVQVAQVPELTFIDHPHAGVCDVDLLPSSLLQCLGPIDEWRPIVERLPTIGDFVRAGEATIQVVGSSFVQVKPARALLTSIGELVRADLDGDGIEDVLVGISGRAVGGSHGHSVDPVVLSRRGPEELFQVSELRGP